MPSCSQPSRGGSLLFGVVPEAGEQIVDALPEVRPFPPNRRGLPGDISGSRGGWRSRLVGKDVADRRSRRLLGNVLLEGAAELVEELRLEVPRGGVRNLAELRDLGR